MDPQALVAHSRLPSVAPGEQLQTAPLTPGPSPSPRQPLAGTQLTSCPWKRRCGLDGAGRTPSCGSGKSITPGLLGTLPLPFPGLSQPDLGTPESPVQVRVSVCKARAAGPAQR